VAEGEEMTPKTEAELAALLSELEAIRARLRTIAEDVNAGMVSDVAARAHTACNEIRWACDAACAELSHCINACRSPEGVE
jgi:hypothetical protein